MPTNALTPGFSFALSVFLTDRQASNLRPKTIHYYRQQITWFLSYVEESGTIALEDITPLTIRSYMVYLRDDCGWADASVHTAARAIRAFLNFLEAEELIEHSPMRRVKMPKEERKM